MILSSMKDWRTIEVLHPLFAPLFDYLCSHDLTTAPVGRIELDGDRLFLTVTDATMVAREEQLLEVHRNYIDVHVPLSGVETIGWRALCDLKQEKQAYDAQRDYAFYSDCPKTYVEVGVGEFLVAYPSDAHAPLIGCGPLRKVIAKVAF